MPFAKPKIKVRMRRKSRRGTVLSANYYYKEKEVKVKGVKKKNGQNTRCH